jgi:hypothetical protein
MASREPTPTGTSKRYIKGSKIYHSEMNLNLRGGRSPESVGNRGPEESGKVADISI